MQQDKESNINFKETFMNFIKTEEEELTQEEAIIKYQERRKKKSGSSDGDFDGGITEEQEHLKRIKQELLESLRRVNDLERKIYSEKSISKTNLKVEEKNKQEYIKSNYKEFNREEEQEERE